jgi:hypothetical protein
MLSDFTEINRYKITLLGIPISHADGLARNMMRRRLPISPRGGIRLLAALFEEFGNESGPAGLMTGA